MHAGGSGLRPILVLAAAETVGGSDRQALPAACAIELIHNYSLTHDDLPCMDDDDYRRGKSTCHRKFDEATALLAGDALFALAFKILASPHGHVKPREMERRLEATRIIAEAISSYGMVGGQVADIESKGKEIDIPTIEYINTHKSGALIAASLRVGALLGGGSKSQIEAMYHFGEIIGFLF